MSDILDGWVGQRSKDQSWHGYDYIENFVDVQEPMGCSVPFYLRIKMSFLYVLILCMHMHTYGCLQYSVLNIYRIGTFLLSLIIDKICTYVSGLCITYSIYTFYVRFTIYSPFCVEFIVKPLYFLC